ncbi:MAG: IS630 family transposase [Paracoccus sp. (in: a-proteobacteria)]|nr:IS630 family transposase [Paracoccus sp. (in: a-proteobacteria)]
MTKPYSDDLRERAVEAMRSGASCRSVAARFGVAPSSVVKWTQRAARTGSVCPSKMGGYRRPLLEPHRVWLLDQVRACPHITLAMLEDLLAQRGIAVSHDTVWRFLRGCGFSFKKTLLADESERPDVRRRRDRWQHHQGRIDPTRLVFIDETWVKTNMAPLRGWAPKGERLSGAAPFGHWNTSTFIAALRHDRIDAPWVFDGPVNGDIFRTYVERVPVPTLRPGDVIVMDNPGSHKSQAVRQAIRSAGAHLLFLPPYSPDLNPIEQAFAKLKHWIRNAAPRSRDTLWRTVGTILNRFTSDECANYLKNAGYASV